MTDRERNQLKQCKARNACGGCPCIFEHQCRHPTPEVTARLEAERKRIAAIRARIEQWRANRGNSR